TQRDAQREVGAEQRGRPLAREIRSRARDADEDTIKLAVGRDAAELDAAEQGFGVRDRRWAGERGGDGAFERQRAQDVRAESTRQHPEEVAERRADDPVERLLVIGIAAQGSAQTGMVQDERGADHRHAPYKGAFDLEAETPAPRARSFEERIRARRSQHLPPRGADERRRASVEDRLRGRDDDDRIRAHERRVYSEWNGAGRAELDQVLPLDV